MTLHRETTKVQHAAVGIMKGAVELHAGLLYRGDAAARVLHLRFHHDLADEEATAWTGGWAEPKIDPIELQAVAAVAAAIAKKMPDILFAFRYADTTFNADHDVLLGSTEHGLTCATFVLAVFRAARIELLDLKTWISRPEDDAAFGGLMAYLERIDPEHAAAVQSEKGCVRFRPEEAAAATQLSALPGTFSQVEPLGRELRDLLLRPATEPEPAGSDATTGKDELASDPGEGTKS